MQFDSRMTRIWILPTLLTSILLISVSLLLINAPSLGMKQLGFALIGAIVFVTASRLPLTKLVIHPWRWWLIGNALLVLPLILQATVRGTARWIYLGPISIQPSQLAFLLIAISLILFRHTISKQAWKSSAISLLMLAIPAILIGVAPDLGTTLFFASMMFVILFITDFPWKHIVATLAVGVMVALISWQALLYPYQKARITSFLSPNQASSASTYNVRQSLIAIGSGGLLGTGLGEGTQSTLRFLPERHTDFIFASFAEQVGFVGSLALLSMYVFVGFFCIVTASSVSSKFGQVFVTYAGVLILVQTSINVSTNLGLLPVTGMTLPLMSAGGTSLIVYCASFGMVQNFLTQPRTVFALHLE